MPRSRYKLSRAARRIVYLAPPIVILCLDFLIYPVLFEGYEHQAEIDIAALVTSKDLPLGTFRAHRISVSMDEDIQRPGYFVRLKTHNNVLVVSVFVDEDGRVLPGALVTAALRVLRTSAPQDAQRITDVLGEQNKIHPGQIVSIELQGSIKGSEQFPAKYLAFVPFQAHEPDEDKKWLAHGLPQAFDFADKKHASNVIVPCLGTSWGNKNSITFDEFFSTFFNSVPASASPFNVYLSVYNEWPSFYLEAAVSSLNSNWRQSFGNEYKDFPALYRREFRLIVSSLALCLLVASISARMTFKNWSIVTLTFVTVGSGLENGVIRQLRPVLPPALALILEVVILAGAAILFRYIVTWNPKNVFK